MTAIAGLVHDGKVYIGGDSAGVAGLLLTNRAPKVFINGGMIFGTSGSVRMSQLLQYEFSPPQAYDGESEMAYMVKRFVPAVRTLFRDGGVLYTQDSMESLSGYFLCGRNGSLYVIESDFQVGTSGLNIEAIGCGHDLIKGSLYTTKDSLMTPEARIKMALEAAEEFSAGVRGPFTILSV